MINWLMNTDTINSIRYGSSAGVSFGNFSRTEVIIAFAVGLIISFGSLIIGA